MIKVNKGSVEISGNGLQIMGEFSTLVHLLLEMKVESGTPEGVAKEMLRHNFETGLKSKKEIHEEAEKIKSEIHEEAEKIKSEIHMNAPEVSKAIADLLDSIFGGKPNADN